LQESDLSNRDAYLLGSVRVRTHHVRIRTQKRRTHFEHGVVHFINDVLTLGPGSELPVYGFQVLANSAYSLA